jgi:DNA-binding MarR family transcriptional regulator
MVSARTGVNSAITPGSGPTVIRPEKAPDMESSPGAADGQADLGSAEAGLTVLLEACERAVEELGSAVPPAQMRALLVIGAAGGLNLSGLARALGASASAASRLCDRMQAAGLLTRDRAAASRREIVLVPTESGRRLAEWVRGRRRAALGEVMAAMSPDGREALARGLAELTAAEGF